MVRVLLTFLVVSTLLAACSRPSIAETNTPAAPDSDQPGGPTLADGQNNSSQPTNRASVTLDPVFPATPQQPTNDANCYPDGEHPIARSIADQYAEITSYEEIMLWFCNGALFEDILNALTTQELSGVDAEELLRMVAAGKTWDTIWLELDITEQ